MSQYYIWQSFITDEDGNVVAGASVTIKDELTGAIVQVYSTETGTTKSNPITADSEGYAFAYVPAGKYRIEIGVGGKVLSDVRIGSPVDRSDAEVANVQTPILSQLPIGDCRRHGASASASASVNVESINKALANGGYVYLKEPGEYLINDNLDVQDDTLFEIGKAVTLKAASGTTLTDTGIVDINGRARVTVQLDGEIDGNKADNPTGRIFGIRVNASTDVTITGSGTVRNCPGSSASGTNGGDGVFVGGNGTARVNVLFLTLKENVRQGLSWASGVDGLLHGLRLLDQTGDDPGGGIDIEADVAGNVKRLRISNCYFEGNYRNLQLSDCEEVTVSGNILRNAAYDEIVCVRVTNLVIDKTNIILSAPTATQTGLVYFETCTNVTFSAKVIGGNGSFEHPVVVKDGCTNIFFKDATFENTYMSAIQIGTTGMSTEISNVSVLGCSFLDCVNSSSGDPVIFLLSNNGSTKYVRNVTIKNNTCRDTRTGGNEAAYFITQSGATDTVLLKYDIANNTIDGTTARYNGCPNEGSTNLTLSGFTGTVTVTTQWANQGDSTTIRFAVANGTSNTNAMVATALPSYLWPTTTQRFPCLGQNNSLVKQLQCTLDTSGVMTFALSDLSVFTTSGTKGLEISGFTYNRKL